MADEWYAAFIRAPSIGDTQEDGDLSFIFNTQGKPHNNWRKHYKFYLVKLTEAEAKKASEQLAQAARLATGQAVLGGKSRFAKSTEDKVKARIASGLPPFRRRLTNGRSRPVYCRLHGCGLRQEHRLRVRRKRLRG
jgi:hypothetical protein